MNYQISDNSFNKFLPKKLIFALYFRQVCWSNVHVFGSLAAHMSSFFAKRVA